MMIYAERTVLIDNLFKRKYVPSNKIDDLYASVVFDKVSGDISEQEYFTLLNQIESLRTNYLNRGIKGEL